LFTPDPRAQQPARALARAQALCDEHPDNPRSHLHHALALYSAGSTDGVAAAIERAQTLGADPASCHGLLLLDSMRRNDRTATQNQLTQFELARQVRTTESLRRVVEGLVRKALSRRQRK